MNDSIRNVLAEIVRMQGLNTLAEGNRLRALLNDLCPECPKEVRLLVEAFKLNVHSELLKGSQEASLQVQLARLTKRLQAELAVTPEAATWTVYSWAFALGLEYEEAAGPSKSSGREEVATNRRPHEQTIRHSASKHAPALAAVETRYHLAHPRGSKAGKHPLLLACRPWSPPSSPIWYKEKAVHLESYIKSEAAGKPVLLSGYNNFGGTFLAQWAVEQAAKSLAEEIGISEDAVIIRINADLVGRSIDNLWFEVSNWALEVWTKDSHRTLRRKIKERLRPIIGLAGYDVQDLQRTQRPLAVNWKAPEGGAEVKIPLGGLKLDSGSLQAERSSEATTNYKPKTKSEQLLDLLAELAVRLQSQPSKGIFRFFANLWNAKIPCRMVITVDRVSDVAHLRALDPVLQLSRGIRVVCVADKFDLDLWLQDSSVRLWIERTFSLLKCLPIHDRDQSVAKMLCDYFFEVPEEKREHPDFKDFVDGLDFFCLGSPARFERALEKLWDLSPHRNPAYLKFENRIVDQCRLWARVGQLLRKEWQRLIPNLVPLHPDHCALGEAEARCRVLLDLIALEMMDMGLAGFTMKDLLARIDTPRFEALGWPTSYRNKICTNLLEIFVGKGIIEVREMEDHP